MVGFAHRGSKSTALPATTGHRPQSILLNMSAMQDHPRLGLTYRADWAASTTQCQGWSVTRYTGIAVTDVYWRMARAKHIVRWPQESLSDIAWWLAYYMRRLAGSWRKQRWLWRALQLYLRKHMRDSAE